MVLLRINYGALPPKVDLRDYKLSKTAIQSEQFPEKFECELSIPVKNQGSVASCVAHATSSILEYYSLGNVLSTNFIYGIQKQFSGYDGGGMYLRDACGIVKKYGDMLENDCPGNTEVPDCWDIAESAISDKEKEARAYNNKIDKYVSLKDDNDVKRFLMNYGPVLSSVYWYNSFRTGKDGVLNDNKIGDVGYHAIMVYGWNDKGFLCQNSWGKSWGNKGRFILPYTIKLEESFGLVDDAALHPDNIVEPKRNVFIDFIYKIINFVINLFKRK